MLPALMFVAGMLSGMFVMAVLFVCGDASGSKESV